VADPSKEKKREKRSTVRSRERRSRGEAYHLPGKGEKEVGPQKLQLLEKKRSWGEKQCVPLKNVGLRGGEESLRNGSVKPAPRIGVSSREESSRVIKRPREAHARGDVQVDCRRIAKSRYSEMLPGGKLLLWEAT